MPVKVLIVGNLNTISNLITLLPKLTTLHSKNNFSLCFLLGDLFSPSDLISDLESLTSGQITIPIPTYFSLGKYPLPDSVVEKINSSAGEVCENLFFLGKKGVLKTSEGVRIVALGGRLDTKLITSTDNPLEDEQITNVEPYYSENECKGLLKSDVGHTDILITYEWPEGVEKGSKVEIQGESGNNDIARSQCITQLAKGLKPRYHFVSGSSEIFWEREPYKNDLGKEKQQFATATTTRFIALADYGNEGKKKWMYAFNLNLEDKNSDQQLPAGTTDCPYEDYNNDGPRGVKRQLSESPPMPDPSNTFFWGDHTSTHHVQDGRREGRQRRKHQNNTRQHQHKPPPDPSTCFFCLSNPSLEKHLIVSIGNDSYLTTAKGPLTNPTANPPSLPFSCHILIIPFQHSPTLNSIDDSEQTRKNTFLEMTRYRLAIERMLEKRGCGTVTFEISRRNGIHFHWQVIPIAEERIEGVEEAFTKEAEVDKLGEFLEKEGVTAAAGGGNENGEGEEEGKGDYFRVWISGKGIHKCLVLELKEKSYFDLQFGRRVLGKLLGLPKIHWKDCIQSHEEEVNDVRDFKEAFKAFDFTL